MTKCARCGSTISYTSAATNEGWRLAPKWHREGHFTGNVVTACRGPNGLSCAVRRPA